MAGDRGVLRIGYIVKMFPRLSETFILNEMIELERQGVQVVVFSLKKPNEGRFHPQVARLQAPVYYLEDFDVKKWPQWIAPEWPILSAYRDRLWELVGAALAAGDTSRIDKIWWAAWIASRARQLGLSRVHAHFASLPSTVAHFVHRITGMPYSFTAHAKDIFVYDMDEHLLREKLQSAGFVVTVTEFNKRYLLQQAPEVDADRIRVIHNGIDLDEFAPDRTRRESDLILGVGRLVPKKGFHDLLTACSLLKQRGVPFRCVIVGDGPEGPALREQCRRLGLEREVTFAGPKNIADVRGLLRRATVFCLPCTVAEDGNVDALPTVLLESLAVGLPSISTTVSGVPEIIESGVDGILVPPDDPQALAEQLMRLLADPALRRRFAEAGRKKALEKFDLHRNVGRLLQAYLEDNRRHGVEDVPAEVTLPAEETDVRS